MKRLFFIFSALLAVFFVSWGVKAGMPINRPENLQEDEGTPWYEARYDAPVADEGWYLDPEIPENYIPVPGEEELYMVVDDSGNIVKYRKRSKQADGSWVWEDVNPDIPEDYEPVDGLENVYRVTGADGTVSYFLYVRNDDDTYCFVPCDENGIPLDDGADASTVGENYVQVDGNTYAAYNDDGVLMGYRLRTKDGDGAYVWKVTDPPETVSSVGNATGFVIGQPSDTGSVVIAGDGGQENKTYNSDGTYTVTSRSTDTVTEDGYSVMYETTVYMTYSADGELLSTKQEGPYEVSRTVVGSSSSSVPDLSKAAKSLDAELARVSSSVTFNTAKANEVLTKLNAERQKQGLTALKMDTSSDAYKVACIRAADMAIYDYCASSSPMYGTLNDLLSKYGVQAPNPSENIWKAGEKGASEIHSRFQANDGSRLVRMSASYSTVGIAIVEKDGNIYVAEVFLG